MTRLQFFLNFAKGGIFIGALTAFLLPFLALGGLIGIALFIFASYKLLGELNGRK